MYIYIGFYANRYQYPFRDIFASIPAIAVVLRTRTRALTRAPVMPAVPAGTAAAEQSRQTCGATRPKSVYIYKIYFVLVCVCVCVYRGGRAHVHIHIHLLHLPVLYLYRRARRTLTHALTDTHTHARLGDISECKRGAGRPTVDECINNSSSSTISL